MSDIDLSDFSDDIFTFSDDNVKKSDESIEKKEINEEVVVVDMPDNNLPKIIGEVPKEYKDMVDRFIDMYQDLPLINYNDLYSELADLNVDSRPTPTLQLINLKLQKVQASKDRLAEIFQEVIRCYTFKKRAVNILSESWNKFAEGTSADKRKSDSSFKLSEFHADLAKIESLYNVCEHILRNLDSQSNSISRQITIIQSQLKMFDMGRGSLPDFDFNQSSLNEGFESLGDNIESKNIVDFDESQKINAEELSF
jgi:hypothetical protein